MRRRPWRAGPAGHRWPWRGPVPGQPGGVQVARLNACAWPGLSHLSAGYATRDGSARPARVASCRRPRPSLLTPDQSSALLPDAQQLGHGEPPPLIPCHPLGCWPAPGLRVGEARRRMITDVWLDDEPPCLHIRDTTFHQSRLVPLPPSTAAHLRHEARLRNRAAMTMACQTCRGLRAGGQRCRSTLGRCFTARCGAVGLGPTAEGRRPRLRAWRHACAVQRLRRWDGQGSTGTRDCHRAVSIGMSVPSELWVLERHPRTTHGRC